MPQASTATRTVPGAGSVSVRSTRASRPRGEVTWAARNVVMVRLFEFGVMSGWEINLSLASVAGPARSRSGHGSRGGLLQWPSLTHAHVLSLRVGRGRTARQSPVTRCFFFVTREPLQVVPVRNVRAGGGIKHAYWIHKQLLISGSACPTARNGVTQHAHRARCLQLPITTSVFRS